VTVSHSALLSVRRVLARSVPYPPPFIKKSTSASILRPVVWALRLPQFLGTLCPPHPVASCRLSAGTRVGRILSPTGSAAVDEC